MAEEAGATTVLVRAKTKTLIRHREERELLLPLIELQVEELVEELVEEPEEKESHSRVCPHTVSVELVVVKDISLIGKKVLPAVSVEVVVVKDISPIGKKAVPAAEAVAYPQDVSEVCHCHCHRRCAAAAKVANCSTRLPKQRREVEESQ